MQPRRQHPPSPQHTGAHTTVIVFKVNRSVRGRSQPGEDAGSYGDDNCDTNDALKRMGVRFTDAILHNLMADAPQSPCDT